jgi:signal transduction histidine kinase
MRVFLIALISLILHGSPAAAQARRFVVSQYNTDNGLPQNSVKDIAFDEWGYCWLATEMGMVRYDGQRFVTYGTSEIKGLESERMEGLTADARGTLYARAYGEQILRIGVSGKYAAPAPVLQPRSSVHVGLQGVAVDEKEMLKKLSYFYGHLGARLFPYASSVSNTEVYLGNEEGLLLVSPANPAAVKIRSYLGQNPQYTIFAGQFLVCLLPGNRIEAWKNGKRLPQYQMIGGPLATHARFLSGDFLNFPADDGFYIYVEDNLYKVSLRNGRLHSEIVLEDIHVPGLSIIRYVPHQDTYYLGSSTDGLFKVQMSKFGGPAALSPTLNGSLYAQADAGNGRLIVKNLVVSLDQKLRRLPIKSDIAAMLFTTADGHMYYAQNYTLRKINIESGKVHDLVKIRNGVVHMSPAEKGGYFFTQNDGFAKLVHDKAVGFKKFPEKTEIFFAKQIRPSYFLVCTGKGLKWYDYERNRIDKSVLESMQIRTVYVKAADEIWISTYGKGFYLLQNKKLYRMPFGPRQALKTVHSFVEDGHGFFWLPSNNGLFKVRKSELLAYAEKRQDKVNFFRFDRTDGLSTNEFNGGCDPSYLWLKDSLLSLPSMRGLVWFYPHQLKPYYPDRGIFADSLTVKSRPGVLNAKGLTLSPDFKRLSIQVSSPYFGNPENLDLEYQVAGLDADWRKVERNGQLTIASLPPGDYKLLVRRNGVDVTDSAGQFALPIDVQPWFYNTWWFYALCICASVGIGYLLFEQRLTTLQQKAQALENVISARTRELKSAVDDLAESEMALLESNRFKDHVITMVLHDMRSPLRFISLISGNLLKNHTRLTSSDLDAYLGDLHMGTQNLLGFTEQFFMWISTQQQGFKISKNQFPVNGLFEEIASLYKELFKVNHNRLTIVHTDLECVSDYQILSVVIRNLIDNANKNTFDGEIRLSCREENDRLLISISDTGLGLTDEQITLFMSRDRQAGNRGTGSLLIHTMLDYIQGGISIVSEPGRGSIFTILLQNLDRFDTIAQDGSVLAGS